MKLLFYIDSLNGLNGVQRSIVARCNMLAARGHEVYILSNVNYDPSGFMVEPVDARVSIIDYQSLTRHSTPLSNKLLKRCYVRIIRLFALDRFLAHLKPDIIVTQSDDSLRGFFLVRHHGAKYVAEWATTIDYNEVPYKYNRRLWLCWMSWHVDKYVFLVKHDLEIFPGPKSKAIVIPTFVKTSETQSPLSNKVVISTGRLSPIKNYKMLVDAWVSVAASHPDWQLHIYGDGNLRPELEQQIATLGLTGKVVLKGMTNNVSSALLNASIFAFTTRGEGFSNSILEAVAHGLPIVITETSCAHDLMDGYEIGYMVAQGDKSALASCINHLIEDEACRRRLGNLAYLRSLDFAREKIVLEHESLYRKLLGD